MVSDVWSFNGRPKPGFLTMINLSTVIQVQSVFTHETQCAAFFWGGPGETVIRRKTCAIC